VLEPNPTLLRAAGSVVVHGAAREVVRLAGHDRRLIVRLAGCEDRDSVEAMRGSELLVARAHAPALGPEEWWAEDLEGLSVLDGKRLVGTVLRLLALPSCEVLEVARTGGGETLLVPLVNDAVRAVDLERGVVDVDLAFLGE